MEKEFKKQLMLKQAYKRIEQLKSFYVHLMAYCVVNVSLLIYWSLESFMPETFWRITFLVATILSGFIVAAHGIFVFGLKYILPKDWEEKQFKKLVNKEKQLTKYE